MGLVIYLAGRITGLPDKGQGWRSSYIQEISKRVKNVQFIDPLVRDVDESDYLAIVRHDTKLIGNSDIIVVNANIQFALGVPMELVIAKYFGKLVISVVNEESPYYRKEYRSGLKRQAIKDWVHPWLHTFSDYIVKSPSDVAEIVNKYQKARRATDIKTLRRILGEL